MSHVSTPGVIAPNIAMDSLGACVDSGVVLDAADEACAGVMQAPQTGDIEQVHFRIRAHTTDSTLEVRLETVDSNGFPSGTLLDTDTEGTVAVTGVGNYSVTLTSPASVTLGDYIAVVVKQPSTDAGNTQVFAQQVARVTAFPYVAVFTTAWAKDGGKAPGFTLEYADSEFHWQVVGGRFVADAGFVYNSGSDPDEQGNRYEFPFEHVIRGVMFFKGTSASGVYVINIYNAADELLATQTFEAKYHLNGTQLAVHVLLTEEVTIAADAVYRITIAPSDANNVVLYGSSYPTSDDRYVDVGYDGVYHTERTDAGAWTDDTSQFVWLAPIMSSVGAEDAGGGSGGRIIGMNS